MRITTSACLVLLLTAGFAMAPSAQAQTGSVTPGANYAGELPSRELGFVHDGRMRSYRIYRPAGLRGRAPAVLVLHGGLGSSEDIERRTGFDEQARRGRFVAVYPQGTPASATLADRFSWNALDCCGLAAREGVDDIGFLSALINRLVRRHRVARSRVYMLGSSNGGLMSYVMGCRRAGLLAGIGVNAAALNVDCAPSRSLPLLHIHGTADPNVLFGGGTGDGIEQVDRPSVPDSVARWSRLAGCSRKRRRGDAEVVATRYTRCDDRVRVALYALVGGGHGYPGVGQCPLEANQPCASNAINATRAFWRFLSRYSRRPGG